MGNRVVLLITGVLLLISACKTSEKAATEDREGQMASLYNPSRLSLHPDFTIFHENESYSILYIRAYPAELRFSQTNEDSEYRALLSIHYELTPLGGDEQSYTVVDSATVVYKLLERDERNPAFFASLTLPIPQGEEYLMKVVTRDLVLGSMGLEYLYVNKKSPYSGQNFKVISAFSGYPKFMRFFYPGERFNIQYRDRLLDSVYVDYYRLENELPRPPITATSDYTLKHTPDTSFVYYLQDSTMEMISHQGMYRIQIDEEQGEGLTLFNFGGSFPQIKSPDELMQPVFYLATLAEYRDLRTEPNRKLAVDNFWLKTGNNMERSRELIRIFYNRVVYSNLYFTSNKEGWKTDQGMIFILFGPPSRIQITDSGESWYYFARRRSKVVEFRFKRIPDEFSSQNMIWEKSIDSQMYWNEAVRSWRKGKVYSMGS